MVVKPGTDSRSSRASRLGVFLAKNISKYEVTKAEPQSKIHVWLRITSNLMAVVVILLSIFAMAELLDEGMFNRRILQYKFQNDAGYWRPYSSSCLLSSTGFVTNSCSREELNLLETLDAWETTGYELAQAIQVPSGRNYKMTTCVVGCTEESKWVEVHFVVGYDEFPLCNPTHGSQPIAGMAMLEATSAAENFSSGAYLLTVFSDISMNESVAYYNSDGTSDSVIANVLRIVIGPSGSSALYNSGINTLITSYPLGPRYVVKSSCVSQIIDIENKLANQQGWSTGLHSKKSVITGYACGHEVANAQEFIIVQVILTVLTLVGISGDLFITFKGLKGVFTNTPVLTYDILSSLERRKALLFCGVLSAVPSLLFVDVARIYFGTANGWKIWTMSIVSLGVFFTFGAFFLVIIVQFIPCPAKLRHRVIPLSAATFVYSCIPAIALSINGSYEHLSNTFYNAQGIIFMNVSGSICSCGAYASARTQTATSALISYILIPLFGCGIACIVVGMLKLYYTRRKWFMDIKWMQKNSFMTACRPPRWISGIPVDFEDAIKMGNQTYCKPSMQARMGYATVIRGVNQHQVLTAPVHVPSKDSEEIFYLVSIYDLIPAMVPASWRLFAPKVFCEIFKYVFSKPKSKQLNKNVNYQYHIGTCVS